MLGGLLAGAGLGALGKMVGSVVGGVSSAVGTGISNLVSGGSWRRSGAQIAADNYNANEAQKARDAVSQENLLNREWQEQMSNTAISRQVADMKNAGINPAMAFAGGGANGASTPSGAASAPGSTAHSVASGGGNFGSGFAGDMNSISNFINTVAKNTGRIPGRHTEQQMFNSAGKLIKKIVTNTVAK